MVEVVALGRTHASPGTPDAMVRSWESVSRLIGQNRYRVRVETGHYDSIPTHGIVIPGNDPTSTLVALVLNGQTELQ